MHFQSKKMNIRPVRKRMIPEIRPELCSTLCQSIRFNPCIASQAKNVIPMADVTVYIIATRIVVLKPSIPAMINKAPTSRQGDRNIASRREPRISPILAPGAIFTGRR